MLSTRKPIKKVIILDAGGVLQPDAEFDLPNQVALFEITNLMRDELNKLNKYYGVAWRNLQKWPVFNSSL